MNLREERNRRLAIALLAAAGAIILWIVFRGVYRNLSISENAVGYVEPSTQGGIYFGYAVMLGGTVILAVIAAWSTIQYLRSLIGRDR